MDEYVFKKQIGTKIRQLRAIKHWSRQQVADKLEMSVTGYGGIERGETDISITRLAQLAEVFEISLSDLLGWNEKTIFSITQDNSQDCNNWQFGSASGDVKELMLNNELEKCRLVQQAQEREIENLKTQIAQLREMLDLLKKEQRT